MEWLSFVLLSFAFFLALLVLQWAFDDGSILPPGPSGLPFVGSLLSLDPASPHRSLAAMAKRWDPAGRLGAFSLRLGRVSCIALTDATLVRKALQQDECTGRAPLFLTHGIMHGRGIICAEGDLWREQRRFVADCLRTLGMVRLGARRDRLERRITSAAYALVQDIQQLIDDQGKDGSVETDPAHLLLHHVGSVVTGVVFGRTWSRDDTTWRWLLRSQEEGTKLIGVAGAINFLPWLRFLPHYRRTISYIKDGQMESHSLYARMAAETTAAMEKAEKETEHNDIRKNHKVADNNINADSEINEDDEVEGPDHILGAFVAEQRRRRRLATSSEDTKEDALGFFDDKQLHYLVADLFGAGLDTTVVSLRWFLLFMAAHPEEQELVWSELHAELGSRAPALDDTLRLPRLQAALAEAQRLRPVVPVGIPHGVTQETRLGEWVLAPGTMILPLLWAVHMDEKHFPDPEEFRPERFLAEDGRFARPAAFMPFQAGKRMCVGETLANQMLFLFGGALLRAFRVSLASGPPPDMEGECGITLAPRPHRLRFDARHALPFDIDMRYRFLLSLRQFILSETQEHPS